MRISDWSSDVCSSDLAHAGPGLEAPPAAAPVGQVLIPQHHLAQEVVVREAVLVPQADGQLVLRPEVGARKSVVKGKRVSVSVDLGGGRLIQKKKHIVT